MLWYMVWSGLDGFWVLGSLIVKKPAADCVEEEAEIVIKMRTRILVRMRTTFAI